MKKAKIIFVATIFLIIAGIIGGIIFFGVKISNKNQAKSAMKPLANASARGFAPFPNLRGHLSLRQAPPAWQTG